jgi:hypothetical protein
VGYVYYPPVVNPQRNRRRAVTQAGRVFRKPGSDSGQAVVSPGLPACLFFHGLPRLCGFPVFRFRVLRKPGFNIRGAVEHPAPDIHPRQIGQAVKRSSANADIIGRVFAG